MQTRKQACHIASKDSAPFRIIQLKAFRDALFGLYGQVSAQVRKISTKQNLINPRYVAQHAEYRIASRKSGVPIHPLLLAENQLGSAACDHVCRCVRPRACDDPGDDGGVRHS